MSSSPSNHPSFSRLSRMERAQLGTSRILRSGEASPYGYVPAEKWPILREHLLRRSRESASRGIKDFVLEERMTAYTPGETLHLMNEPEVVEWYRRMENFEMPAISPTGEPYRGIVFVPCAKTKPWEGARRGLYAAYNEVREEVRQGTVPPVYFVTISEPLGVVPESHWADFPQYDNPGLFADEAMRSGLIAADWPKLEGVGEKYVVPFDPDAYDQAIERLSIVIARFVKQVKSSNPSLEFVSVVANTSGGLSTHSDMLERAHRKFAFLPEERRYAKKARPREKPTEHVAGIIRVNFESLKRAKEASTLESLAASSPSYASGLREGKRVKR